MAFSPCCFFFFFYFGVADAQLYELEVYVLQLLYCSASQGEASDAKWNVKRGVKHKNMGSLGLDARPETHYRGEAFLDVSTHRGGQARGHLPDLFWL